MLVDMMSGKPITAIPFAREYREWTGRMTPEEITNIKRSLNELIEGTEIQTAGWMPGSDWRGTPYQPIYEKAARRDPQVAARCFGLIVWVVFMDRPEVWTSGRFENGGEPIGSRTYFQPQR